MSLSKPDWKDAPSQATHLAMDSYGNWGWYNCRPFRILNGWCSYGTVYMKMGCGRPGNASGWGTSLESRPEVLTPLGGEQHILPIASNPAI